MTTDDRELLHLLSATAAPAASQRSDVAAAAITRGTRLRRRRLAASGLGGALTIAALVAAIAILPHGGNGQATAVMPADLPSAQPHRAGDADPCGGTGINLHAIAADTSNRAKPADIDRTNRPRAIISPNDPRTFLAHVSKTELSAAGINISNDWSDNLILIANHGTFSSSQVAQAPVGQPVLGDGTVGTPPSTLNWQIRIYDAAHRAIVDTANGVDNICLHD